MTPTSPLRPESSTGDGVDTAPLLGHPVADHLRRSRRHLRRPVQPLRGAAARILRQASGRRLRLREPSMQVRDNAAEQLENRQSDWAYSKPIVVLDILWNFALVGVALHVLVLSAGETPVVPLRLWILGYILQCSFHIVCVMVEFMRRRREMEYAESDRNWRNNGEFGSFLNSSSGSEGDSEDYADELHLDDDETSIAKHLESANTMFSFVWWIIGFYWIDAGGQDLTHDAPQLYWLCVMFLVLDVVFVVLCVSIAGLIGIAVCCCLPCIIAILYAVTDQEGATHEDIARLPKFRFRCLGNYEKVSGENQAPFGGVMVECGTDSPVERALSQDDAECCICISSYDDGSEICELPCNHHFHSACIEKWLYINATCPLCKFNILKCENGSFTE